MILAIDIGGTNIRSAIVNGENISSYKKIRTPEKKGDILRLIEKTVKSYPGRKKICIATAGFERKGKIQHSLNADINGLALSSILRRKFKVKVYLDNDANCAALAELYYGIGKGLKNFVLLTLGTGIGGAIVISGKLYRGNGAAGEIGSIIIDGGKIFEHLASGDASVALAGKIGFRGISSLDLEMKANHGNKKAIAVYNKVGEYLGIGFANLAHTLDPDAIIVGGGFSRVKHIYAPARRKFEEIYSIKPRAKILKAKFGDDAGLVGAGLLAKI
jgi:glucokinase